MKGQAAKSVEHEVTVSSHRHAGAGRHPRLAFVLQMKARLPAAASMTDGSTWHSVNLMST
jgi:hypothetical protein